MKRGIIRMTEGGKVSMPLTDVWMTKEEIADMFGLSDALVFRAIRSIYKKGELYEHETTNKISFPGHEHQGWTIDVYNLDLILNLTYKLPSRNAQIWLTRKEELEIPLEALREALINALCHRSYDDPASSVSLAIYDDRVEIVNPGKFPVGITAETILLPHESFPHNQRIAQVLYQTTYLENWGTGVRRMAEICRQQGKQSPTFEEGVRTITICFKKESRAHNVPKNVSINVPKVIFEQLTERQRFIVDCIIHNASVSQTEMSQKAGVSRKTIQREIENMRFIGLKISREGSKKDGKWVFKIDD